MGIDIQFIQQILDLIYCESVRRRVFDKFIETLSALIGLSTTNPPNEEISTEHNGITESTVDVTGIGGLFNKMYVNSPGEISQLN